MTEPVKVLNMNEVNDARNELADKIGSVIVETINKALTVEYFTSHEYFEHRLSIGQPMQDYVLNMLNGVYTEAGWKISVIYGDVGAVVLRFEIT